MYTSESFQDFFTDAEEIRLLMTKLLGNVDGKTVLEPCVGKGAFLESLVGWPNKIEAIDIDGKHLEDLKIKNYPNVKIQQGDFISHFVDGSFLSDIEINSEYDALICNPPYGLKFSIEYRKKIKKLFPNLYARESYGLFFYFGVNCLKESGHYVFIIPDTFLTSRNHKPLREFIVKAAAPTDIIQFDSSRFESVNFGYGGLCVIAGRKQPLNSNDTINWKDLRNNKSASLLNCESFSASITGSDLIQSVEDGWASPTVKHSIKLTSDMIKLGEIAECRTGIYTGDNSRFCAYDKECPPKRKNGHPIDWENEVYSGEVSDTQKCNGISEGKYYVPFVRGGHRKPLEETRSAIDWSETAISFYKSNEKSRFQNSSFYFRTGLAIPMVTSGRISASLISDCVFDQGVVGVFPENPDHINFLLIYLNSNIATELKKALNPGANNSANYIKKLPVPRINESIIKNSKTIIADAVKNGWDATLPERETLIKQSIGLSNLP
ncbi:Eco57I restriction-modification methylase domain-containing protein [Marinobacter nauticus]|uniref:Eco57I restriction-modification methylase domain-containing protein n=1 Tax=Marinobacter nauticus TaxID=2743 RepID=UPI003734D022